MYDPIIFDSSIEMEFLVLDDSSYFLFTKCIRSGPKSGQLPLMFQIIGAFYLVSKFSDKKAANTAATNIATASGI